MKLYKILVEHFSPKDSHDSIECFLLAENDDEVYNWLDKKQHGYYSDVDYESCGFDIYDDNYEVVGHETFKEHIIRCRGEMFSENVNYDDLYYGKTIYGWEEQDFLGDDDIVFDVVYSTLKKLGVLEYARDED